MKVTWKKQALTVTVKEAKQVQVLCVASGQAKQQEHFGE